MVADYRKNLVRWLISLSALFFSLIILGAILQKNNYSPPIIGIMLVIIIPSFFFILAYYGIRRKTGFLLYFAYFGALGAIILKILGNSPDETKNYKLGFLFLFLGILISILFIWLIFFNKV